MWHRWTGFAAVVLLTWLLVAVNYGEFASAHEAETFGAAALGLTCDEYYAELCALSDQFTTGGFAVTVEQDGEDCPIVPPMSFTLTAVAPCQSAAAKLTPTSRVGGFAFVLV